MYFIYLINKNVATLFLLFSHNSHILVFCKMIRQVSGLVKRFNVKPVREKNLKLYNSQKIDFPY